MEKNRPAPKGWAPAAQLRRCASRQGLAIPFETRLVSEPLGPNAGALRAHLEPFLASCFARLRRRSLHTPRSGRLLLSEYQVPKTWIQSLSPISSRRRAGAPTRHRTSVFRAATPCTWSP